MWLNLWLVNIYKGQICGQICEVITHITSQICG